MATETSSRDSTAKLNMSDMFLRLKWCSNRGIRGTEKRRGRDTGLSLCCGYKSCYSMGAIALFVVAWRLKASHQQSPAVTSAFQECMTHYTVERRQNQ